MSAAVATKRQASPAFEDFVVLEQIRLLEGEHTALLPELATDQGFEPALVARGKALAKERGWLDALRGPDRLYRYVRVALLALAALLGLLAVSNALAGVESQRVINIYWLMLVLLGFNTVSLLLWIAGFIAQASGLIGGTLGGLPIAVHRLASRLKAQRSPPEYTAWLSARFDGKVGLWRLSTEGHKLWLLYLFAGFAGLLVLFSVRQYDFVWGSTLLTPSVFVSLTETLSLPLVAIGLAPPDAANIVASRGVEAGATANLLDADLRRQWALFLLGSLLVYGVLPRALCLVFSALNLSRAESDYRPDFYLPYYVALRHRQRPASGMAEVVDPDDAACESACASALSPGDPASNESGEKVVDSVAQPSVSTAADVVQLPEAVIKVGIELSQSDSEFVEVNIVDRESQSNAQQLLQQHQASAVMVVVRQNSTADRGIKRRIEKLLSGRNDIWLLIHCNEQHSKSATALEQWYQLAQSVGIQVDNIRRIDLRSSGLSS